MIYFWLIPLVIAVVVLVWVLYFTSTRRHGAGVRTPGRTVYHRPKEEKPSDTP